MYKYRTVILLLLAFVASQALAKEGRPLDTSEKNENGGGSSGTVLTFKSASMKNTTALKKEAEKKHKHPLVAHRIHSSEGHEVKKPGEKGKSTSKNVKTKAEKNGDEKSMTVKEIEENVDKSDHDGKKTKGDSGKKGRKDDKKNLSPEQKRSVKRMAKFLDKKAAKGRKPRKYKSRKAKKRNESENGVKQPYDISRARDNLKKFIEFLGDMKIDLKRSEKLEMKIIAFGNGTVKNLRKLYKSLGKAWKDVGSTAGEAVKGVKELKISISHLESRKINETKGFNDLAIKLHAFFNQVSTSKAGDEKRLAGAEKSPPPNATSFFQQTANVKKFAPLCKEYREKLKVIEKVLKKLDK